MAYINGKHIPFIFEQAKVLVDAGWQYAEGVYIPPNDSTYNTGNITLGFKPDIVYFYATYEQQYGEDDIRFEEVLRFRNDVGYYKTSDGVADYLNGLSLAWTKCAFLASGFRVNSGSATHFAYPAEYHWVAIKIGDVE